jgi:hypothetical protein
MESAQVTEEALERRMRAAALAVMLGLAVELISLAWHSPSAFIVFVGLGGLLMATGMLLFLLTIVKRGG